MRISEFDVTFWANRKIPMPADRNPDVEALEGLAREDAAADGAAGWWEPLRARMRAPGILDALARGLDTSRRGTLARYARVAEASLSAALILTQHDGAFRRLRAAAETGHARSRALCEGIARGEIFPTIGISQLTTSRRLGSRPLLAEPTGGGGWRLRGSVPWVTSAGAADVIVCGAHTPEGLQLLFALDPRRPGVRVLPDMDLAAMRATGTAEVACEDVAIEAEEVMAGPAANALGSATGGLETSALALGQTRAVLLAFAGLAGPDGELSGALESLAARWRSLWSELEVLAEAEPGPTPERAAALRLDANDLAVRAAQIHLIARKGAGLLRSDPAQRWARQALFFLVWSCPTSVARGSIERLLG